MVPHVIPGVPFVKQETQYCGPASLASVLCFYGDPVDQHVIGKAVFMEKIKGSLITDLQDYAKGRGFEAKIGCGTPEDIKRFILQDRPVIVLVDFGFWVISRPHYLVVYGFNEEGFIAHDGFQASKTFHYEKFQDIWKKSGSSYLLVYR
jgi:ABC-type bacteriocin/lantibiotic exporter with double-glycine peptidase domain